MKRLLLVAASAISLLLFNAASAHPLPIGPVVLNCPEDVMEFEVQLHDASGNLATYLVEAKLDCSRNAEAGSNLSIDGSVSIEGGFYLFFLRHSGAIVTAQQLARLFLEESRSRWIFVDRLAPELNWGYTLEERLDVGDDNVSYEVSVRGELQQQ